MNSMASAMSTYGPGVWCSSLRFGLSRKKSKFAVIGEPVSSFDKLDSGLGALDSGGDFGVHLKTPNVGGQRQP